MPVDCAGQPLRTRDAQDRALHIQLHRRILHEFGHTLNPQSRILDFGCGDGGTVLELRSQGFDAYGVDIKLEGRETAVLRLISTDPGYRIPFDDETFDFVFSDQVFEHVQNPDSALAEISRVLKPGGIGLHLFPPRYRPLEAHTFVPLAGTLQGRAWLSLWALLGIRNTFQAGLPFTTVAARNYIYLHNNTHYLTKRAIRKLVSHQFGNVSFGERHFIKHSYGRARQLHPVVRLFPQVAALFSCLHQRVVFFEKHSERVQRG